MIKTEYWRKWLKALPQDVVRKWFEAGYMYLVTSASSPHKVWMCRELPKIAEKNMRLFSDIGWPAQTVLSKTGALATALDNLQAGIIKKSDIPKSPNWSEFLLPFDYFKSNYEHLRALPAPRTPPVSVASLQLLPCV